MTKIKKAAHNCQLLRSIKGRSDNVAEQYTTYCQQQNFYETHLKIVVYFNQAFISQYILKGTRVKQQYDNKRQLQYRQLHVLCTRGTGLSQHFTRTSPPLLVMLPVCRNFRHFYITQALSYYFGFRTNFLCSFIGVKDRRS